MRCPRCGVDLEGVRDASGMGYPCAGCGGEALTMAGVRKRVAAAAANAIWRGARGAGPEGGTGAACPTCARPMATVTLDDGGAGLTLDGCERCALVWFDAAELARLPARPAPPSTSPAPLTALQAQAQVGMRIDAALQAGAFADPLAADSVAAEHHEGLWARVGHQPVLSYALAALLMVIHMLTLLYGDRSPASLGQPERSAVVDRYAFDGAEPWRHGGLTWVTSFLVSPHTRRGHLFAIVVLAMVGYLLERRLGRWRFLAILALGHGAALCAYALAGLPRTAGLLGASAGAAALWGWAAVVLGRAYMNARRLTGAWWQGWHVHGASAGAGVALGFGVWFLFTAGAALSTPWELLVSNDLAWPRRSATTPAWFVGGTTGMLLGVLTVWKVGRGTGTSPGSEAVHRRG